jgi:WD40 repeat protein
VLLKFYQISKWQAMKKATPRVLLLLVLTLVLILNTSQAYSQLEEVWRIKNEVYNGKVYFSKDGQYLYGKNENNIGKLDVKTGKEFKLFDTTGTTQLYELNKLKMSKQGNFLASVDGNGNIEIWDIKNEKLIFHRAMHTNAVDFTLAENVVIFGSATPKSIIRYNFKEDKSDTVFIDNIAQDIATSNDGKTFVVGFRVYDSFTKRWSLEVQLWDFATMKMISVIDRKENTSLQEFEELQYSPNSRYISIKTRTTFRVKVYDMELKKINFDGYDIESYGLTFLPDNKHFVVHFTDSSGKATLQYWDFNNNKIATFPNIGLRLTSINNGIDNLIFCNGGIDLILLKESFNDIIPIMKLKLNLQQSIKIISLLLIQHNLLYKMRVYKLVIFKAK